MSGGHYCARRALNGETEQKFLIIAILRNTLRMTLLTQDVASRYNFICSPKQRINSISSNATDSNITYRI